ncbi:MAG: extracellular solute-binding protein [Spirochaetota bacterium]
MLFLRSLPSLSGEEVEMLYMAQAGYQPADIIQQADSFYRETGIKVNLSFVEYEDQYNLIIQSSQKTKADFDVILVDLIWTADFAENRIIEPIPGYLEAEVKNGIIPEIYSAFTYLGKIWAIPFLANFQLFYSNMELLNRAGFNQPPASLEEVIRMAETAKERGLLKYPLFDSLRKQEALVCEYVWLVGAFGGDLVEADGRINLKSEPCLKALRFLKDLLDRGLLNPYSLNSEEVFAAEVFLAGDSLFTTNWTFLTGLIKETEAPIARSARASLIPVSRSNYLGGNSRTSTVSGFQGLSVTRNSGNKRLAWQFIRFLSSPEFQKMHLDEMSVWKQVWSEEKTSLRDPEIALKKAQIIGVHNRPIHPQYRKISASLQEWIYKALLGDVKAEYALSKAQAEIDRIIGQMGN